MSGKPKIICSAIRDKLSGITICGPRHHHCFLIAHSLGYLFEDGCEQGFVDQFNTFYNRKEARIIAVEHNQIIRRCGGDEEELYSENLF